MKLCIVSAIFLELLLASAVSAQIKVGGKQHCPKPQALATTEAGDEAGHTMTLEKSTCTWVTPLEMLGERSREGTLLLRFPNQAPVGPQPMGHMSGPRRAVISSTSPSIGRH